MSKSTSTYITANKKRYEAYAMWNGAVFLVKVP